MQWALSDGGKIEASRGGSCVEVGRVGGRCGFESSLRSLFLVFSTSLGLQGLE